MNDTVSITSGMNYTNYEEEDDKSEIEGGWGSSSYSDNLNSTMNMTNEEFLRLYLGPNQVRKRILFQRNAITLVSKIILQALLISKMSVIK